MSKKVKSRIEYILFIALLKFLKLFPYKMILYIVRKLAVFVGMVIGIRKEVARKQLKRVFPNKSDKEIKALLKDMYYQFGWNACETFFAEPKDLFKKIEFVGKENMEAALAMNKGVIVATAHLGNFELGGRFLASMYPLTDVGKTQRNGMFDEFANKLRREANIEMIDMKFAAKTIFQRLKQNYLITLLMDQNAGKRGVLTDFLGFPASTFTGAAKFSIKTKCPIVPAVIIRNTNGTHTLFADKPIIAKEYSADEKSAQILTENISKQIEKYILQYPTQWFWVHKRWKGFKKAKGYVKDTVNSNK
jgi:Kdo2-lipid IVA lauroyltransferase/acyltransferase